MTFRLPPSPLCALLTFVHSFVLVPGLLGQQLGSDVPRTLTEQSVSTATFGRLIGARELGDGRVLVSDGEARALFVVDLQRQTKRQLGRTGDGPGEYRSPGAITALAGDTSFIQDNNNRKWYFLEGDRFVATPPWLRDRVAVLRGDLGGVSQDGTYLDVTSLGTPCRASFRLPRGRPECSDSVVMIRRRPEGSADTVASGKSWFFGAIGKQTVINGSRESFFSLHPLQSFDQGLLFSDGAIAIARVQPYRVEWIDASGIRRRGPVVSDPAAPLTPSRRAAITENYARDVNGEPRYRAGDFPTWPSSAPAFLSRALLAGPDGGLYVLRSWNGAERDRRVDVFERDGQRRMSFLVPVRERLLAVGRQSVYTARTDENEEAVLVRYRLPPARTQK